ncbi:phage shock protein PspA [Zymomonas mobilis]|uniref:Phage shock protein A, PspA n=1 Tax=Zymomonas mobilis subsp. pomaceae (strain ATCC 29192 / DSM 22645 / JCM 10191 / CCUG 17912 / NBRC 13757 / NCIMB 11200 / NRRL B-4491 / Barker I) TaxID=579138 RepID=F8EU47_ZYMMT|nr:phage shock protein PspA [Zymomonas mobilis]AEI37127.1 phage shock protein A, PspA [Zymomonas mobilis subsp. pomaceae ATCC 29192]MDX5948498.1 phage shock protein PspA [Zymomonas mobilis subsp. pomaceae]GEB89437.1 phage shock protein PspA [Zymomonas mobilis subsp. pomaceae]
MGIFSRTRDIVAANVMDILNRSEDPEKMIRMIILEMEETLIEVRASAAKTIADQKEIQRQINRLKKIEVNWLEKAEIALNKGREDLAKAALVERHKAGDLIRDLAEEESSLNETLKASEDDITKLQNKLNEARSRQSVLATRYTGAKHRLKMRELYNGSHTEEAFARFETLERRVDHAEGRAEAAGIRSLSLEEEIASLQGDDKVEKELSELKDRLQHKRG